MGKNNRPVIAVSANWVDENQIRLAPAYTQALIDCGLTPLIVPVTDDIEYLTEVIKSVDGLLLTGGGDLDPSFWGEKIIPESGVPSLLRDKYDITLVQLARRYSLPILGICRGMQVINVAFGGSLYQDIYVQNEEPLLQHSQECDKGLTSHKITINSDTLLHRVIGKLELDVNTIHHQAVKFIPPELDAEAFATDGIIEAIEMPHYRILAVQWHPEHLQKEHSEHRALFDWLANEARLYKKARLLHAQNLVIDSHTDTPMVWDEYTNLGEWQDDKKVKVDFQKMQVADVAAIFMVAYLRQFSIESSHHKVKAIKAHRKAVNTFTLIKQQVAEHSNLVNIAYSPDDIIANKKRGLSSVVLAIENGFALDGSVDNVDKFASMGAAYITLCHNGDNDICDSAKGAQTHGGISDFGLKVIDRMNALGVMVDISHSSDNSMRQAIEYSKAPVVATHSSVRSIASHPRNLSDDLIKLLASKGGVMQICLYNYFLSNDGRAVDIYTACDHIDYVKNLVGVEYVGVGSDFDGGGGILGCNSTAELINITIELYRRGYTDYEVSMVMGGSFIRVWRQVQSQKT
ncbi:MAG: membrane dipeptidase [bacterium]